MRRETRIPRADWAQRCEAVGLTFHTIDGERYWDERAAYVFTLAQVERIEAVVEDLHARCLDLVDWIVRGGHYQHYGLPTAAIELIEASWQRRDPSLYGRFDLSWDGGSGEPKLLEYNADTPTGLVEASVAQWFWLEDVRPRADQFNSLHERLVARWQAIVPRASRVHFAAHADHEEDGATVRYLMDTAQQAGLSVRGLAVEDIGFDRRRGDFVDDGGAGIDWLFKLYPWEWMWQDEFACHLPASRVRFLEPPWKLLLSCKAMLPLLWQRNPGHPNLLPAAFADTLGRPVARKPRYSREGANIELLDAAGALAQSVGPYGADHAIWQALAPLPCFDQRYPVIGAWVIGDAAAGIGIREDATAITRNSSCFVPHYFEH